MQLAHIQMAHVTTNEHVVYSPLHSPFIANAIGLSNVVIIRCKDALPDDGLRHIPFERISFLCDRDDPRAFVNDWEKPAGDSECYTKKGNSHRPGARVELGVQDIWQDGY